MVWNISYFSIQLGIIIIPTDELIFFRGVVLPPTSIAFWRIAEPVKSLRTLVVATVHGKLDQLTNLCSSMSCLSLGLTHGSLNVPIEHHPTIRYMVYNGYYKVMSNIPKMGHLPTPVTPFSYITGEAPKHGQVDKSKAFTELPSALDSIRSSAQISSHTRKGPRHSKPLIPSN